MLLKSLIYDLMQSFLVSPIGLQGTNDDSMDDYRFWS